MLDIMYMGAIMWGTRGMRPPIFSDSGDIICHVPHIFLFRFRIILVSHQAAPLTFYNKIVPMIICTRVFCYFISTAMCGNINDSLIVVTMLLPLLFCMFEVAL